MKGNQVSTEILDVYTGFNCIKKVLEEQKVFIKD